MIVYISKEGEGFELLTPEISKCPNSFPEMQVYVERYLRHIRDDLMRFWEGEWRLIDVGDHLEMQHMDDPSTPEIFTRKFRVRKDAT